MADSSSLSINREKTKKMNRKVQKQYKAKNASLPLTPQQKVHSLFQVDLICDYKTLIVKVFVSRRITWHVLLHYCIVIWIWKTEELSIEFIRCLINNLFSADKTLPSPCISTWRIASFSKTTYWMFRCKIFLDVFTTPC